MVVKIVKMKTKLIIIITKPITLIIIIIIMIMMMIIIIMIIIVIITIIIITINKNTDSMRRFGCNTGLKWVKSRLAWPCLYGPFFLVLPFYVSWEDQKA